MKDTPLPCFSLIIPTLHRDEEVARLFQSIHQNTLQDLEVILIDQNEDNRLDDACSTYAKLFPLQRVRIRPVGVSHARNHGRQFARGRLLNFPDDDCELTHGLLQQAADRFAADPGLDLLFARSVDPRSLKSSVTRFSTQAQAVTPRNVYSTTVEFTMFLKQEIFDQVGPLDERLGVGTSYGAEEGADFVLRALYLGKKLHYDPSLVFHHAQKTEGYDASALARAYSYGRGFGRLSLKHLVHHHQPGAALRFVHFQCRAAAGMLLHAVRRDLPRSRFYLESILGRSAGLWNAWQDFRHQGAEAWALEGKAASP
jgi:glycosyltransferase involved in cell wall biosynthesis